MELNAEERKPPMTDAHDFQGPIRRVLQAETSKSSLSVSGWITRLW